MQDALNFVKSGIESNMAHKRRNASMRSVRSLKTVVVNDNKAYLEGLMSYTAMERGRAGGKVPKGFAAIIYDWMVAKGVNARPIPDKGTGRAKLTPQERGNKHMAYFIAKNIKEHGTRLHRTGGFDDIFSSNIEIAIDKLGDQLLWFYAESISKKFEEKKK